MPAPYSSISIPKRLLMGPGPSEVDPRVYRAMTQPVVGYLDGVLLHSAQAQPNTRVPDKISIGGSYVNTNNFGGNPVDFKGIIDLS